MKRYQFRSLSWENGKGWVPNIGTRHHMAQERLHKRGGWCKWKDVKPLIEKLDKHPSCPVCKHALMPFVEGGHHVNFLRWGCACSSKDIYKIQDKLKRDKNNDY